MPNYTDADLSRFTYSHTWANRDEVKKIVQDLREARKEVDRLNDLNGRLRAEDVRQQQEVERLRAELTTALQERDRYQRHLIEREIVDMQGGK